MRAPTLRGTETARDIDITRLSISEWGVRCRHACCNRIVTTYLIFARDATVRRRGTTKNTAYTSLFAMTVHPLKM